MKFWVLIAVACGAGAYLGGRYGAMLAGAILPEADGHGAWYASRAAGLTSYLFLWLGLVGGLMMSSAWFDGLIGRARLLAMHQVGTIAGCVMGLGHGLILIPDEWTDFTVSQVLVPFSSSYQPFLSGIGTLTLYLAVVVTFSFWFKGIIGTKAWKMLHWASFLVFAGALYHGAMAGTDTSEPWVLGTYYVTGLGVVFGIVIRITYVRPAIKRKATAAAGNAATA